MNKTKSVLVSLIITMVAVLPVAPIFASPPIGQGPSIFFMAWKEVASGDTYSTWEFWTIAAYQSEGAGYTATQSHLTEYMLVYEMITFNYNEGDYWNFNGTMVAWGTLSPESFSTTEVSFAPARMQPLDEYTFYGDSEARTSGSGALVVMPVGSLNGDMQERAKFALTGSQTNTQSNAQVAGTFACSSGPTVFNAALNLQITGQVYGFSYVDNEGGTTQQVWQTGNYATHRLSLAGGVTHGGMFWQSINGWGVVGDAYPDYTNRDTFYILNGPGLPWSVPFWWD